MRIINRLRTEEKYKIIAKYRMIIMMIMMTLSKIMKMMIGISMYSNRMI